MTTGPLDVALRIEASLVEGGFKVTRDSVAGRQTVIARRSRFGVGPHVFVLIGVFKPGMVGREHLDRFLDEAGQYAATVKGRWPSGASVVAVAVVESGGGELGDWAHAPVTRPGRGLTEAFPALVDLAAGRLTCPDAPSHLRQLVQAHVVPGLGSPP